MFDQLFDYRTRLLARLESQPAQVADRLAAIPERDWYRPRVDGRSVHRLLANVRDVETLSYLPWLRRILREERPELAQFASQDLFDRQYRPDEPLTGLLTGWSQTRAEVVDLLPPAAASPDWSRTGFHPPSGRRTLQWWAERVYGQAREQLQVLGSFDHR